ncbi:MAG: hypothetical protein EP343_09640 [Deltaproteobacteria bacterium]|nr:MAG: hypothetical protein EP343_09640 [Deltaproteobacteria bacterium]
METTRKGETKAVVETPKTKPKLLQRVAAFWAVVVWLSTSGCFVFQFPCKRCESNQDCAGLQQCRKQNDSTEGFCMNEQQGYLCPGFSCKTGDSRPCYSGPPGTAGQSRCRAGRQFCIDNVWEPCQDEVKPEPEECNNIDDDCDGKVDEGVSCVVTLAGGSQGYANGLGRIARFNEPRGIAQDKEGSLYVADTKNHRIRKIEFLGDVEVEIRVQLWAGTGEAKHEDGFRTVRAAFNEPRGLALDATGNLYVADTLNDAIRFISTGDQVSTLSGGGEGACKDSQNSSITWREPTGLAFGPQGELWIADTQNHILRKLVAPSAKECSLALVVGDGACKDNTEKCYQDGKAEEAQFFDPSGVAVDSGGNVYVADYNNHRIRKIDTNGQVTTLAGDGTPGLKDGAGKGAQFRFPRGLAVDVRGNLYVADTDNHAIRKISRDGTVSTLAGDGSPGFQDGDGQAARLNSPWSLVVDAQGAIYVADSKNHRIRKVTQQANE